MIATIETRQGVRIDVIKSVYSSMAVWLSVQGGVSGDRAGIHLTVEEVRVLVAALSDTLPEPEPTFEPGDRVLVGDSPATCGGGYVDQTVAGCEGTVGHESDGDYYVVGDDFSQYIGPKHLTKVEPKPACGTIYVNVVPRIGDFSAALDAERVQAVAYAVSLVGGEPLDTGTKVRCVERLAALLLCEELPAPAGGVFGAA